MPIKILFCIAIAVCFNQFAVGEQSASPTLNDFIKLEQNLSVKISPDGKSIGVIT